MKEYVFKIVSENGKCRVELSDININGKDQPPELMAALTREFLASVSSDAARDAEGFMKAAVANLKVLQLARQLRDVERKVN
ncbi:hypothetical protein HMPREF2936_09375 [Neisseria sp. HMSC064F04]|nr:hypothetical protein HMPREF2936_09375 [Neisseria sp. HMSC064F04]